MDKKIINVMFMGFSGSGKDTQAELLQKKLEERDGEGSVLYVYTGAHLRDATKKDTITGRLIQKNVMEAGAKAPDFLAIWAWANDIINRLQESHHIVLSSSPRTKMEAEALDGMFSFYGRTHVYPIYLNVDREEAFSRLKKRGRFDDTDETINNRLDYFQEVVASAIKYYQTKSRHELIEIDGNPHNPEAIHEEIIEAIRL